MGGMELYIFVSKAINNLCWARELYVSHSIIPYVGYGSALLHAGSLLESSGCWVEAFRCLGLNECGDECLNPALPALSEVPVYEWFEAETSLKSLARIALLAYSSIRESLLRFINNDLGLRPWRSIYVGLAYSPNIVEPSSRTVGLDGDSPHLCVLVPPSATAHAVIDSVIGEALANYVRKGLIPLIPDLGWEVVRILAPSGRLSSLLGLSQIPKPCGSRVCMIIDDYFKRRGSVREGLISYLVNNLSTS